MHLDLLFYLSFNGKCAEALAFYRDALGGELNITTFRESPMAAETAADQLDRVLHARLHGDGWKIFASDVPAERYRAPNAMVNLSLNTYTIEDAEAAFEKLSRGGEIFMPLQKTFWAERFGMFADKYGFSWSINYELPQGS